MPTPIEETEVYCQRTIHLSDWMGKAGTRKCGKKATHKQLDGLPICHHHYNKYIIKNERRNNVNRSI